VSAVFAEVWVDAIRLAHGELPPDQPVTYARPDGSLGCARELVIELPPPAFARPRRLTVAGTGLDGEAVRDAYEAGGFPAELEPLAAELARAQRECPWEL
jgi:hypothetical protein